MYICVNETLERFIMQCKKAISKASAEKEPVELRKFAISGFPPILSG